MPYYRTVKVWCLSSHQCLKVLHHDAPITALAISHLLLVSCCMNGSVTLWNMDSFQPLLKMHTTTGAYIRQLARFSYKFYAAGRYG